MRYISANVIVTPLTFSVCLSFEILFGRVKVKDFKLTHKFGHLTHLEMMFCSKSKGIR